MGGKPSTGTSADKRLAENTGASTSRGTRVTSSAKGAGTNTSSAPGHHFHTYMPHAPGAPAAPR